jgi:hypothetical protein
MEFINMKCKKCGNIKKISETEAEEFKYGEKEHCFICGGEYELIEENNSKNRPYIPERNACPKEKNREMQINEIVHTDLIEGMKKNISTLGNDKVFDIIEKFKSAEMRLSHRKLFLEAGGEFPITRIEEK